MPVFSSRITDARVQIHPLAGQLQGSRVLLDLRKFIHLLLLPSLLLLLNSTEGCLFYLLQGSAGHSAEGQGAMRPEEA